MQQKKKATLVITFITSIIFIGVTINSINRGIENHEIWRIIVASIGGVWFVIMGIISAVYFFKKDKETA